MSSTLSHGGKVMDPKVIVALDFLTVCRPWMHWLINWSPALAV